jgi:DNA-binding response OmpR family regulator
MKSGPFRVLCVGDNPQLLELRCAVLSHMGYEAKTVYIADAYEQVRSLEFDLVIMTTPLAKEHPDLYAAIPVRTQILLLDGVTFPVQLLAAVTEKVKSVRSATGVNA